MDARKLQRMLDDVFDQAVFEHGYVDYMRDYEVLVYGTSDPVTGIPPAEHRFLFRHCVEARVVTTVSPETWAVSLDDRLTDTGTVGDLDGYVWGVKWHCLYPGATVVPESAAAQRWSEAVGIDFHEVRIQTNAHDLTLVFSELTVTSRDAAT